MRLNNKRKILTFTLGLSILTTNFAVTNSEAVYDFKNSKETLINKSLYELLQETPKNYKIEEIKLEEENQQTLIKETELSSFDKTNFDKTESKEYQTIKAYPHNTFKSYMSYKTLASNSPQRKLCNNSQTDPSTAILKYNDRYLVALGFAYADYIGEEIDVVMESGEIIPVIVGDWKAKEDTDEWNSSSLNNGSIIEFIVAGNKEAGRAVNGSGDYNVIFNGKIKEFIKIKENI